MTLRRLIPLLSLLAIGALLVVALAGPASSAKGKPDVTASDLQEPPDARAPGQTWRQFFSVADIGNARAGILTVKRFSSVRFFLDLNPDNSSGRITLRVAKVGGIAVKSEISRATHLTIPAGLAPSSSSSSPSPT